MPNRFETRPLSFKSHGSTLAATLTLPRGAHEGTPLVVITGAWTAVQEQMPTTYANALAARGFAALTFDFRGWGQSGDLPDGQRYIEDPTAKTEDISAVFAALDGAEGLPQGPRFGLGICASAGYMLDATAANPVVAATGLVAPWLHNRAIVEAVYGGPEGVDGLKAMAEAARAKGGEIIPAAGPAGTEGVLMAMDGYYSDPARGAIAAYDNKWNQSSWTGWLDYDPISRASAFDKPLALVHSDAAAVPEGAKAYLEAATGDATGHWLDGVEQFDFYDDPAAVDQAADLIAAHFKRFAT